MNNKIKWNANNALDNEQELFFTVHFINFKTGTQKQYKGD